MVLEPVRWVLHMEAFGDPILGSAFGDTVRKSETTKALKLTANVDFDGSVSIKGAYRAITGSLGLNASAGKSWEVVRAKSGSFAVNNFFEKNENLELITTNAAYEKAQDKHKASNSGYVKTVEDMYPLYRACGRDLITARTHFGGFLKYRNAMAQLQVAVDPTDATLYVTGTGSCNVVGPADAALWVSGLIFVRGIEALVNKGPTYPVPPLTDYRGLWGKKAEDGNLQKISFSVGNKVKVWVMPILAV
ncbi:hypothetical protein BGX26_008202 [Mortierella sp. AD094]|nr:hypothetical protein BGX26_008202 [Mortierella sp. AD094]